MMGLTRTELFKQSQIQRTLKTIFEDIWMVQWCKEAGLHWKNSPWEEVERVVDKIPPIFDWRTDYSKEALIFTWIDSEGETKEEEMPLSELVDEDEDGKKFENLKILWHSNYYDGPLSGMALWDNRYVWFSLIEEDMFDTRLFGLYTITTEQLKQLFERHLRFREMVGIHTDHEPKTFVKTKDRSRETTDQFFEWAKHQPKIDPQETGEKLGEAYWFNFKNWTTRSQEVEA